ncbi:16S rRNA methyltransferase [Caldimicrobium thiodismutans]|uniref:Ribosomal RNA small subunit methyltransferase H n=1 Tax=Caldimicrobium thiodismutans TaxID=1653476 RepID=A0A0U5AMV7_9BACT|nr:16S rRNA (cytosine(1402)-N(4))-methyltransferase RsmH [Caldimicrobium thiodismutans]BAU23186.1 16S rRNA methyltransferase [Caldimicrobium thiodismutans]
MEKRELIHHEPVLLEEVLKWLKIEEGKIFVDGTLGLGGHSSAILKRAKEDALLYAFEWNEDTLKLAEENLRPFQGRVKIIPKNFVYIKEVLEKEGVLADAILLDLGLSSFLIEGSGRGFTFQKDEPLDMRMSLELELTARDILNRFSEREIAEILERGEVPRATAFARFIVQKRRIKPLETTFDLVSVVKEFYRPLKRKEKDLLAIVFQSIRMEINRELENLEKALKDLPEVLRPGGRLGIISFHSLEDRLVKRAFKNDDRLLNLTKKPVTPSPEEVKRNPRARSAKLRVAERRC